jgi:hypothetical protein
MSSLGQRPRINASQTASAESAIHSVLIFVGLMANQCIESRLQRWVYHLIIILGAMPQACLKRAISAKINSFGH